MKYYDLIKTAKAELKEQYEGPDFDHTEIIHTIADDNIPIYNSDRLEIILDAQHLWCQKSDILTDGSIVDLAGVLIGEDIEEELFEYLDELDELWLDSECEECYTPYRDDTDNSEYDSSRFCSRVCQQENEINASR